MEGTWTSCVVALGSNMGDRHQHAFEGLADIQATEGFVVSRFSTLHETVALTSTGPDDQKPRYVNQVILLESAWSARKTLDHLLAIEHRHGRSRTGELYEDRTLDLDLIVYGDMACEEPGLVLPHPRAHQRRFVLEPWQEVDPDAVLLGNGSVARLLESLPADSA